MSSYELRCGCIPINRLENQPFHRNNNNRQKIDVSEEPTGN